MEISLESAFPPGAASADVAISYAVQHSRRPAVTSCLDKRDNVYEESLEQRGALCFQNEFSGIVWILEDYYKFLAEAKPACWNASLGETTK